MPDIGYGADGAWKTTHVGSSAWPDAPTDLAVTPSTDSPVVHLAWTGASGAVHYTVESQDEDGDGEWTIVDDDVSATTYDATVPGCGRSYAFQVAAVGANGGVSPFSDATDFVTTDNEAPTISNISAGGPVTGTSATLTATVSDDGGLTETLTYSWSVTPPSGGDAWFGRWKG